MKLTIKQQALRVYDYIRRNGSITTEEARKNFAITNLPRVVYELRMFGYTVSTLHFTRTPAWWERLLFDATPHRETKYTLHSTLPQVKMAKRTQQANKRKPIGFKH